MKNDEIEWISKTRPRYAHCRQVVGFIVGSISNPFLNDTSSSSTRWKISKEKWLYYSRQMRVPSHT